MVFCLSFICSLTNRFFGKGIHWGDPPTVPVRSGYWHTQKDYALGMNERNGQFLKPGNTGYRKRSYVLLGFCTFGLFVSQATAQERPVQPPDSLPAGSSIQEVLRIPIEEVRIPVFAFDNRGRFDPTLTIDDLLVRENGTAQRVTGVYRVPAYVLVLADTGGDLNPVKTVSLTRSVAIRLVSDLRGDDSVALMQVNNAAELIKGWSLDRGEVMQAIKTKLLPTKRSNLAEGLARAADYVQTAPAGNRHLVIISDGYVGSGARMDFDETLKELAASGITVHVISYTLLSRKAGKRPITYAKAKSNVPEEIIITLPAMRTYDEGAYVPDLKDSVRSRGAFAVDVDRLLHPKRGDVKEELARREVQFVDLASETGGVTWLPIATNEVLEQAAAAARDIDTQYVVTYRPTSPFAEAKPGEYRKLDVFSRRVGLYVRSRRGYVVNIGK